jgi:hypothetical protein
MSIRLTGNGLVKMEEVTDSLLSFIGNDLDEAAMMKPSDSLG